MTTKVYLLNESYTPLSGTLPSGEQDPQTPTFSGTGASTLRWASDTSGSSMTFISGSTSATTNNQAGFFGIWALTPLSGSQTVGGAGETILVNVADYESNLNSNFYINRAHVYVWRPSTNSLVGDCCTYSTSPVAEPSEPSSASSIQVSTFSIALSSVSASDGDIIIIELWSNFTQSSATSYTARLYYGGATETGTENTVVSNHASYFQFSQTFTFKEVPARLTAQSATALYETTDDPYARLTAQSATTLYETSDNQYARLTAQSAIILYEVSATEVRVSQEYVESLSKPSSTTIYTTQEYAEAIFSISSAYIDIAVTQEYVEILNQRINYIFNTQIYIEVLCRNFESIYPARVTHIYAEVLNSNFIDSARVTHTYAEVLSETDTSLRVSHNYAEAINIPLITNAGVTHVYAEILNSTYIDYPIIRNINVN